MRQIKFRAWDKEKKCFVEEIEREFFIGSSGGIIVNFRGELMQFTGLHDKNGKEIYEGDIIRSTENNEVLKIGEMLPLSRHLDILAENIGYYEGKKYHLRSVGGQHHLDDWVSNPEFYEIIGNIYENPDLLPVKE